MDLVRRLLAEDVGQGLVEYAQLMTFIAFVCVVGVIAAATSLNTWWGELERCIERFAVSQTC